MDQNENFQVTKLYYSQISKSTLPKKKKQIESPSNFFIQKIAHILLFRKELKKKFLKKNIKIKNFTERRIASSGGFENQKRNSNEEKRQQDPEHQHDRKQSPARNPTAQRRRRLRRLRQSLPGAGARYSQSLYPLRRYVKLHLLEPSFTPLNNNDKISSNSMNMRDLIPPPKKPVPASKIFTFGASCLCSFMSARSGKEKRFEI